MNDKSHLVYMTGLSVDKKRMNNIVELINFDKDFTYWRTDCIDEYEQIMSFANKFFGRLEKVTHKQISIFIEALTSVGDFVNFFEQNSVLEDMSDDNVNSFFNKLRKKIESVPKTLTTQALKKFKYLDSVETYEVDREIAQQFFTNDNHQEIKEFLNGDFFSLYLSNQSDSIGVVPLAKVSTEKQFNLHHTYCDYDYYHNQFIDSVILKVPKSNYGNDNKVKEIAESLESIFKSHIRELMFSRVLWQNFEKKKQINTDNQFVSLFEMLSNNKSDNNYEESLLQMFGDRNFFGVSLLSKILYLLESAQNENMENLKISLINNEGLKGYSKEIIEYSSDPSTLVFENADSAIEVKIYTSDGKKIEKNVSELNDDELFCKMFLDLDENKNDNQRKNIIENKYIETTNHELKTKDTNQRYIVSDDDFIYIKVPIKIMLSLPLDTNDKNEQFPNQELYIPKCIDHEEIMEIDILTVGGVEHNRALSHLVNKHRFEKKEKRLFGFMDNYYDMNYKVTQELNGENYMEYSFFMGLNQPVSGWNYVLNARLDSKNGSSVNSDVKYLHFKLKDEDREYRIVSIYGFSAIASVLGINLFIAEQIDNNKISFEGKFSKYFNNMQLQKNNDTASAIYFESNPKGIIFHKFGKCYQYTYNYDIDNYVKFLKNENNIFIKDIIFGRLSSKNSVYQEEK